MFVLMGPKPFGIGESKLFSSAVDKPPGCKRFYELETVQFFQLN